MGLHKWNTWVCRYIFSSVKRRIEHVMEVVIRWPICCLGIGCRYWSVASIFNRSIISVQSVIIAWSMGSGVLSHESWWMSSTSSSSCRIWMIIIGSRRWRWSRVMIVRLSWSNSSNLMDIQISTRLIVILHTILRCYTWVDTNSSDTAYFEVVINVLYLIFWN